MQIGHHIVQRHARFTEGELLGLGTRGGLGIADTVERSMQLPGKADGRLLFCHILITGRHRGCLQLTDNPFNTLYSHDSPLDGFLRGQD